MPTLSFSSFHFHFHLFGFTYYNFSQLCQLSPSPPKSQLSRSQQSRHWKKRNFLFAFNFTFVCFAERRHFIVGVWWGGRDAKAEVCKGRRPAPKPQDGIHKFRLPGKSGWLVQLSSTGKADLLLWHIWAECISAPCPTLQRMLRQMEEMEAIRSLHGHTRPMGWNWAEEKLNLVSAKWRSQCVHNIFASQKQPPSVSVCN